MGQQAAVTLNTIVYTPDGSQNGIVKWMNRSGGVAGSFSPLTQGVLDNSGARKWTKFTFRLDVPVVATSSDSCACTGSVIRDSRAQIEFWVDPNATLAERTDLYLRVKDLAASTLLSDAVENLSPAYA